MARVPYLQQSDLPPEYRRYVPAWVARVPETLVRWWVRRFMARTLRDVVEYPCPITTASALIDRHGIDGIDLLKVDVEGAELEVLEGVTGHDWSRIRSVVVEVQDVDGRLGAIDTLLRDYGLTELTVEQEAVFRGSHVWNVYARRP